MKKNFITNPVLGSEVAVDVSRNSSEPLNTGIRHEFIVPQETSGRNCASDFYSLQKKYKLKFFKMSEPGEFFVFRREIVRYCVSFNSDF